MLTNAASTLLAKHWRANRTPVSDACAALAVDLASAMPGAYVVHVPSCEPVFDWRIPEYWNVTKATLTAPDGRVIADFADNPICLWAHSIPFSGTLTREELEPHIRIGSWHCRNIYRPEVSEWGFSLPAADWQFAGPGPFTVNIEASIGRGHMAYVDATIGGKTRNTILLCAHTCHPAQVADGLANCLLLMDLYNELRDSKPKYTYRFILGPETFTGLAWLAKNDTDSVVGGLYLDMLAAPSPLMWQESLGGRDMNRLVRAALAESGKPYRSVWGNDEKVYSSRPWRMEMPVLARERWGGYHTASDNPENCPEASWTEAATALRDIVRACEEDCAPLIPANGPACLSRRGLYGDLWSAREREAVEQLQVFASGNYLLSEIAVKTGVKFGFLADMLSRFKEAGLAK